MKNDTKKRLFLLAITPFFVVLTFNASKLFLEIYGTLFEIIFGIKKIVKYKKIKQKMPLVEKFLLSCLFLTSFTGVILFCVFLGNSFQLLPSLIWSIVKIIEVFIFFELICPIYPTESKK